MESLVLAQHELCSRIARTYDNLKKVGQAKINKGLIATTLKLLDAKWAKFEEQHELLVTEYGAEIRKHEYGTKDFLGQVEEVCVIQRAAVLELEEALTQPTSPKTGSRLSGDELRAASRTTFPRIQLPSFSGRYEDWPAFRDLFQSIIGKDSSIAQVEKMHYLKTCLKGEAELLIRNIATTGDNYDSAWEMLSAYYENTRLLVRAYLANFLSLQKMRSESPGDLRKILHCLKATVSSLENIGRPIDCSEDLFVYLSVELLDARSRREWENSISDSKEPPSFDKLELFLDRRLHTLESTLPIKADGASSKPGSNIQKSTRRHFTSKQELKPEVKRGRCALCQRDHFLMLCDGYKKKTALERKQLVEASKLCLNCLGRHQVGECASKKACSVCDARHHSSLHDACRETAVVKSSHVAQGPSDKPVIVLLATARVRVADRHGLLHPARALIDQGSESSIISERLAQRLRLPRTPASVSVFGVGGQKSGHAKGRVALSLSPRHGGAAMSIPALVLPRITVYAGGVDSGARDWPHLQGLELADPEYGASDPVDILLGADIHAAILCQGLRKGRHRELVAQNMKLGWILSGAIGEATASSRAHTHQCRVEEDLAGMVRRFWEQEEMPLAATTLSKDDQECEDHFVRTHTRGPDGRYTVRLPVVEPLPDLSGTRRAALRVLKHMETRFSRDASFHELYADFLRQYADLHHMTPASSDADRVNKRLCYLPHHGVMREASSTTKLRVVFNGSSRLPSGETLNQHLQVGPNLLPALADILLRWRRHRYAIASDIEKMYRQIDVHPQDRDLQRIVWREGKDMDIKEFQLNTVTYGLACAPYLAIRTLRQLADDEASRWPLGADVLRRDVYMDDVLTGAPTVAETEEIQQQLTQICRAGGFPLKKWSANHSSLLESLPAEDLLQREPRWWQPGESHATLGLRWHPHNDNFAFSTPTMRLDRISKRTVLSLTAKLFDPMGWLAPTTVRAKILIQSTWLLGVDWDTPLPDGDAQRWLEFQAELPLLESIRVPRWLNSGTGCRREIHGFADASERAYAAVAYLRTEDREGRVEVALVTAKTKVAPLKQITLPRLELCAATLLARLISHIRHVLEATEVPLHLWSDSTVALGWIRGHPTS
ncbi:uncharacterized protein LOC115242242 [Formica exsecta]|uniref:uncharacterized protein LOC115242242 n=3 Tax=Formica exsecta TaxID=72781 RepID=UPI0011433B25|nr:uncharacterized protein LOC115242242 [Formica exsecta]